MKKSLDKKRLEVRNYVYEIVRYIWPLLAYFTAFQSRDFQALITYTEVSKPQIKKYSLSEINDKIELGLSQDVNLKAGLNPAFKKKKIFIYTLS